MPVSASKLVTLAQLQVQAERVKQELAKYTLASELGSLAKKSEISEADLSAALKSVISSMISPAEKYLGSGNLLLFWTMLKELLNGHESNINDLLARVKLLELILSADVTGNPYYVTFNTLTDVVVSSGIWNEADGRIEF